MKTILVITTEPLPFPGGITTGAGLRAWGLAQGLKHKGFNVILSTPLEGEQAHQQAANPELQNQVRFFNRAGLPEMIEQVAPEVIVLQHWGIAYALPPELKCPLVIDLAGPHLLERKFWGNPDDKRDLQEKLNALQRADFITCSGKLQREYFYSFLLQAGIETPLESIPVIPFSVPPARIAIPSPRPEPLTFIYGGAFLAWQNPERPIRWLLEVMDQYNCGRLLFYGGSHPELDVSGGQFLSLFTLLKSHHRVEIRGWKPFEQLCHEYVTEGHVALDLMERNPERELAYTTRTMIYMYCGLPVIYNNYSELSEFIHDNDTGWILDPENEHVFKAVIRELIQNPVVAISKAERAQNAALNQNWNATIEPLAEYCRHPFKREKVQESTKSQPLSAAYESLSPPNENHINSWQRSILRNPGRFIGILIYIPIWMVCKFLSITLKVTNSPRAHKN